MSFKVNLPGMRSLYLNAVLVMMKVIGCCFCYNVIESSHKLHGNLMK
ncbi:hypothetical protein APHACPA_0240 [Rickettsia amblyommatis str. Ac/Pa]|uniref:Uncharacterized protein n=1 Tax=Rickettsia amblyommatis str. Ac/Pa TaxID=1359164 RepID=A0A0F3MZQ3_RICAM|nr:hypothetical protein APHACPA_0240 [Rickettsia amblyommatis str. Ac/Pa]